jgi:hypothetical protein
VGGLKIINKNKRYLDDLTAEDWDRTGGASAGPTLRSGFPKDDQCGALFVTLEFPWLHDSMAPQRLALKDADRSFTHRQRRRHTRKPAKPKP